MSGNPLSWFNNNGDRGLAFFSLNNDKYFNNFQRVYTSTISLKNEPFNMRIIRT